MREQNIITLIIRAGARISTGTVIYFISKTSEPSGLEIFPESAVVIPKSGRTGYIFIKSGAGKNGFLKYFHCKPSATMKILNGALLKSRLPIRVKSFIAASLLTLSLSSCSLMPKMGCEFRMTKKYIESDCGLVNGVRFEELEVHSYFDSSDFPASYTVKVSFECYRPGSDSVEQFWPERIYFNKPNGHYLWTVDSSTNGRYNVIGIYRDLDTTAANPIMNSGRKFSGPQSSIFPGKFKSDTWYYVNFYDQRYKGYVYIDKEMNFIIHKIDLSTSF